MPIVKKVSLGSPHDLAENGEELATLGLLQVTTLGKMLTVHALCACLDGLKAIQAKMNAMEDPVTEGHLGAKMIASMFGAKNPCGHFAKAHGLFLELCTVPEHSHEQSLYQALHIGIMTGVVLQMIFPEQGAVQSASANTDGLEEVLAGALKNKKESTIN